MSVESNHRAILIIRKDNPAALKFRGDISSIIPATQTLGLNVDVSNGFFTIVFVVDLPVVLESELIEGTKKIRVPEKEDPMYTALESIDDKAGKVTINTVTLLNYVELVNV